jgi:predicted dehydrogenase
MADGEILQRFTPPAIRVVQYAKEEARRLPGSTVGTEHILLGLIREGEGVAARVLEHHGVSPGRAQREIRRQMGPAKKRTPGQTSRSWSPEARRVLEVALDEARELNPKLGLPNFLDTEHLLLALLHEPDSTAASVLRALGVDLGEMRQATLELIGSAGEAGRLKEGSVRGAVEMADRRVELLRPVARPDLRTFGIGFIGFGFMGKTHAYGYLNLPLFYDPVPCVVRFVGVATARPETAEAAQRALGFEVATTDWHELIARDDIDIIHVCTPNKFHAEQVLAALAAGKHVYCDKPLCTTRAEADAIAAALIGAKTTHQMVLHNRFFPATLHAKQLVEQGAIGEVLSLRGAYLHSGSADPNAPLKWKLSAELGGGGVLLDLGSHALDLAQHLVGPLRVEACSTHIAFPDRPSAEDPSKRVRVEAEDAVVLTVRTESGALGHIEASKIATGAMDELSLEVSGTKGALRFNLMQPDYLWYYDQTEPPARRGWRGLPTMQAYPPPAAFPPPKVGIGWLRAHAACLHSFLRAVAEGRPAEPGLEVGVQLQHLMADAYEKAARG